MDVAELTPSMCGDVPPDIDFARSESVEAPVPMPGKERICTQYHKGKQSKSVLRMSSLPADKLDASTDPAEEEPVAHGKIRRKQSKSIIDIFCSSTDHVDAAVGQDDEEEENPDMAGMFLYNMKHKNRGIFIILNHKTFSVWGASTRKGTDSDRGNLYETATSLGFAVYCHNDLTVEGVEKLFSQYASVDYTDSDCFACAVLTHGETGDILYAKDGKYSLQKKLLAPIRNCQSLAGKPKLFFIQACRGTKLDSGMEPQDQPDALMFEEEEEEQVTIPVEADFFIGYSTVEGYYAWRNEENGSWFIQALCFCLKRFRNKLELMQIMTRVNRMVAYDFQSNVQNPAYYKKKQMPSIVTRLTKDLFLTERQEQMEVTDGLFAGVRSSDKVGWR